jgi:hypothetical protein
MATLVSMTRDHQKELTSEQLRTVRSDGEASVEDFTEPYNRCIAKIGKKVSEELRAIQRTAHRLQRNILHLNRCRVLFEQIIWAFAGVKWYLQERFNSNPSYGKSMNNQVLGLNGACFILW